MADRWLRLRSGSDWRHCELEISPSVVAQLSTIRVEAVTEPIVAAVEVWSVIEQPGLTAVPNKVRLRVGYGQVVT